MALQTVNFGQYQVQKPAIANILSDFFKGYQMGQLPQQMAQEQKQKQLAAALQQLQLEHLPKQYELSDQQTALANALKQKDLSSYDERFALEKEKLRATIAKLKQAPLATQAKFNGIVANYVASHPNATQEDIQKFADRALEAQIEHTERGTERTEVLNATQYSRGLSPISKKYDELKSIQQGYFPGTNRPLNQEEQTDMTNRLLLSLVKDTTDPKVREKLINANNMNITLDGIDSYALTNYSGIPGAIDKIGDSIEGAFGEGSPRYQAYISAANQASFAAKQMRQYLGDSIQPSAQEKLEKFSKPEAWNVSPKLARENFEFMRDLYKKESQTLVRAATDPTLYQSTTKGKNPETNSAFTVKAPKIPNDVKTKEQFTAWLQTLNPEQRLALKAQHQGGR